MHVMSEHRPPSKETYEERRDRVLKQLEDGRIDDAAALRMIRAGLPWRDWLVHDFFRYWYMLGAAALDSSVVLWIAQNLHTSKAVVAIAAIGAFVAVGAACVFGYVRIWPEGPFTKWKKSRKRLRKLLDDD